MEHEEHEPKGKTLVLFGIGLLVAVVAIIVVAAFLAA